MRYEGKVFRPPSEADSYILQATIGCSWNHCTYCDMYRDKQFRVRPLEDILEDIQLAAGQMGHHLEKVFVADGDALKMEASYWSAILEACRTHFPRLKRVSCYATALNLLEKEETTLKTLWAQGLSLLYIGPESGDELTLKRIAKGSTFDEHIAAAERARAAGMELSAIFLLGAGGIERSVEHATASAALATAMDPQFLSALTLTVIPGTPLATLEARGKFELPDIMGLLGELRVFVAECRPTNAVFRSNHASNYLPIRGRLPKDRDQIVAVLDRALDGQIPLRPEWARGL